MTGSEFRHRRLRLGWSRDQIAHSIGVPAEAIQRWENGESSISCPAALEQILRQTESASERFARPADRNEGTSDGAGLTRYE